LSENSPVFDYDKYAMRPDIYRYDGYLEGKEEPKDLEEDTLPPPAGGRRRTKRRHHKRRQ